MKAIIRPAHNGGKTHVYITYEDVELNKTFSLYTALCRGVVKRTFYSVVKPQIERKIQCEKCERLARKLKLIN